MLKRFIFSCIALALMVSGSFAEQAPLETSASSQGNRVLAYYFHGDFRCVSCHKIETYTKEALDKYFSKELSSGKLVFKTINVDRKENQHFIKDYQLYTKAVVISLVKDGKEVKYENLKEVWNHLRDKQSFFIYIKDGVSKYLKDLG